MSLRFDLDLDTTRNLRDPLGLESLRVNRNLEKNGGFETLWVILHRVVMSSLSSLSQSGQEIALLAIEAIGHDA